MTHTVANLWSREIMSPPDGPWDPTVAVFTGIYGQRWVDNAIDNLERQQCGPIQVVMALNGYDNQTLERLLDYQRGTRHRVWVVVNERNLGPSGSYYRNRDLIGAEWTAFMHQDDVYLERHIEALRELALGSPRDAVALFTALGGISEDGQRRMAPPPMDNAALRGQPSWVVVPEIIRQHPFPTPAVATRTRDEVLGMAWYDSGAPDSEWFARLACMGTLHASDEATVLYRQPVDSESSTTDWHTRAWLWSASLDRIISSQEFAALLRRMPDQERTPFARALLQAIPARYPSSELFRFLQFAAAQAMCDAWQYKESVSVEFVANTLGQWGRSAAVVSLEALSTSWSMTSTPQESHRLLGAEPHQTRIGRTARRAYRRYAHLLPAKVRKLTFKVYRRTRKGVS